MKDHVLSVNRLILLEFVLFVRMSSVTEFLTYLDCAVNMKESSRMRGSAP